MFSDSRDFFSSTGAANFTCFRTAPMQNVHHSTTHSSCCSAQAPYSLPIIARHLECCNRRHSRSHKIVGQVGGLTPNKSDQAESDMSLLGGVA